MHLKTSFRRLLLLSLPLASTLSVPQKILAEDPEDTVTDLAQQPAVDDVEFNVTAYSSQDEWNPTEWDYDVVIVGGGPGGLAASMSLARVARTSLLYDSEEYRNEKTRYMHDVLGQDGNTHPYPFAYHGRMELTASRPGPTEVPSRGTKTDRRVISGLFILGHAKDKGHQHCSPRERLPCLR